MSAQTELLFVVNILCVCRTGFLWYRTVGSQRNNTIHGLQRSREPPGQEMCVGCHTPK